MLDLNLANAQLSSLSSGERLKAILRLASRITVVARSLYLETAPGVVSLDKLASLNEVQQQIGDEILALLGKAGSSDQQGSFFEGLATSSHGKCEKELEWAVTMALKLAQGQPTSDGTSG